MNFDLEQAKQHLPQTIFCEPKDLPASRPPRLLSAQGFAPSLETSFSGTTYHMALAGLSTRQLEGCFSLYSGEKPSRAVQVRGALWKAARLLRGQKSAGFKFTSTYVDQVWPEHIKYLAGATVISNFQVMGREFLKRRKALDIGSYFYIDGTLADYFESYNDFDVAGIDPDTRLRSIEVEKEGYAKAEGIAVMSRVTAKTLQERYGVPANKISVVLPGANLRDDLLETITLAPPPTRTGDFIIGFVGLYPIRKGLDRLAKAVQILRSRRLPIRLRVIGKCPDELLGMDGLEYLGVISKRTDFANFVKAISSVHLGCLVSRSELAGIAMVEFLRLGVPVLGTSVGGATDILEGGGTVAVNGEIGEEELAEVIAALYHDHSRYALLKKEAESRCKWASWKRAVAELDAVLP